MELPAEEVAAVEEAIAAPAVVAAEAAPEETVAEKS
jgi:hypothetical protein